MHGFAIHQYESATGVQVFQFHGWRSLVGCSPWGHEELDTTERLHFHFSLSCIGEGNGNPLQCSCLENPRDGGVWWAAISGIAQSWTRLKRLSSSSMTFIKHSFMCGGFIVAYLFFFRIHLGRLTKCCLSIETATLWTGFWNCYGF